MRKQTARQQLVRNCRRCLADLVGGHVWKWSLWHVKLEAHMILWDRLRRDKLAKDEVANLSRMAAEYEDCIREQSGIL